MKIIEKQNPLKMRDNGGRQIKNTIETEQGCQDSKSYKFRSKECLPGVKDEYIVKQER